MQTNYHINEDKGKTETAVDRLALIERLLSDSRHHVVHRRNHLGRNWFSRTMDFVAAFARKYLPPVHWLGATLTAVLLFFYAYLVVLTGRLRATGEKIWPNIPPGGVLALWHHDAPSLIVAFAMSRPKVPCSIMISGDSRGDCLTMLCRFLGLHVVRGGSDEDGWLALGQLSKALLEGSSVIITADGGGPSQIAKVGAVALASATDAPLVPLRADCYPAMEEHHKWDRARNPLPFSSVFISLGPARRFGPLVDAASIERARRELEESLNSMERQVMLDVSNKAK